MDVETIRTESEEQSANNPPKDEEMETIKTESEELPVYNSARDEDISVQVLVPNVDAVDLTTEIEDSNIDTEPAENKPLDEDGVEKKDANVPEVFTWRVTRSDNKVKKEFKCQDCAMTFTTQPAFNEHKNYHILTRRDFLWESFPCTTCKKSFPSKTGLLNHMRLHIDVKTRIYTCAICEQTFKTNKELLQHKPEHTDAIFTCKLAKRCSELTFTDHYEYLVHQLTHNKTSKPKCFECGTYIRSSYMKQHLLTHYDLGLKCNKCGESCTTEIYLKIHMRKHDIENEIKCVECGKIFNAKNCHDKHMLSHTQVKKVQCLYCGKGFATAQQRDIHARLHTGEKPFACDICGHKSRQKVDAARHRLTHSKEKKFECDYCQRMFYQKECLMYHIRLHTKSRIFKCKECSFWTTTKTGLRAHTTYKHLDAKPFSCDICNIRFKTKGDIERHNLSKSHRNMAYGVMKDEAS